MGWSYKTEGVWELRDDSLGLIGQVRQFDPDGPYYGTTSSGRTGPMSTLDACKARVEKMIVGA